MFTGHCAPGRWHCKQGWASGYSDRTRHGSLLASSQLCVCVCVFVFCLRVVGTQHGVESSCVNSVRLYGGSSGGAMGWQSGPVSSTLPGGTAL